MNRVCTKARSSVISVSLEELLKLCCIYLLAFLLFHS